MTGIDRMMFGLLVVEVTLVGMAWMMSQMLLLLPRQREGGVMAWMEAALWYSAVVLAAGVGYVVYGSIGV